VNAADDGIDVMRARMARGQRTPPAPPRSVSRSAAAEVGSDDAATLREPVTPDDEAVGGVPAASTTPVASPRRTRTPRVTVRANDPPVNLAIRVRKPLDDHLVEVLHRLRRADIRSSKVELIEMLLWEMPGDLGTVRSRLAEFRSAAPRGGDAIT